VGKIVKKIYGGKNPRAENQLGAIAEGFTLSSIAAAGSVVIVSTPLPRVGN
jgi:hypothetical protein